MIPFYATLNPNLPNIRLLLQAQSNGLDLSDIGLHLKVAKLTPPPDRADEDTNTASPIIPISSAAPPPPACLSSMSRSDVPKTRQTGQCSISEKTRRDARKKEGRRKENTTDFWRETGQMKESRRELTDGMPQAESIFGDKLEGLRGDLTIVACLGDAK
jgi:hypothetical protein